MTPFLKSTLISFALVHVSLGKLVLDDTDDRLTPDETNIATAAKALAEVEPPHVTDLSKEHAVPDLSMAASGKILHGDPIDHMAGWKGPIGDAVRDGTVRKVFLVINTMMALAVASGLAMILLRHSVGAGAKAAEEKAKEETAAREAEKAQDRPAAATGDAAPAGITSSNNQQLQQAPAAPAVSKASAFMATVGPIVLVWYCFFSVSHTFFQHRAANVNITPIVPTIIIYFLKLVLALNMYLCQDGTIKDLYNAITSNRMVCVWYLLPAACLAFYDVFSFLTLAKMAPSQYQILLHLRTVLIALFWQAVMAKRLSPVMWCLLLSCIYAALLTERAAFTEMLMTGGLMAGLGQYTTLGIQYSLSITGNLSNELFLTRVKLPVNAQNVILYSLGLMILCTSLLVGSIHKGEPMFPMKDLPLVLDSNVLMSIVTLTLVGISTGFVLKLMGNIWKELAGMVVTFITASIDWFVLQNRQVGPIDIQALVIISCSLAAFSLLEKGEAASAPSKQALLEKAEESAAKSTSKK